MKAALFNHYLDGSVGTATFPTCVFFDSDGVQQESPTGAESMTLLATTTKQSLTEIILTAARVLNPSLQLADIEAWKRENNIVGMRSAAITGNPCDVYFGNEQVTTPVYTMAVGARAFFGVLPDEAVAGGPVGSSVVITRAPVQNYQALSDGTDEDLVSASARWLYGVQAGHINDAPIYVNLYDKATAPDENDTPSYRMLIPANSTAALGAGSNVSFPNPIQLINGLGIRIMKGIAVNNDTKADASEVLVNVQWSV